MNILQHHDHDLVTITIGQKLLKKLFIKSSSLINYLKWLVYCHPAQDQFILSPTKVTGLARHPRGVANLIMNKQIADLFIFKNTC